MVESRNNYTAILINHDSIMGPCVSVACNDVERIGLRGIEVVLFYQVHPSGCQTTENISFKYTFSQLDRIYSAEKDLNFKQT